MAERYGHSAYWYAKKNGWTYSEKMTYTGQYLDILGCSDPKRCPKLFGSAVGVGVNPLLLGTFVAMDIGVAVRDGLRKLADPVERDRMKRELMRDLRQIRRPFYYARETERRRRLAEERRKINRRTTTAPMPTPADVLAAWNARKESREAMVRLGGLLQDLECYVDNRLRIDSHGNIVSRGGGIRGWLKACLPELSPKYKTLMRYKALAVRLRQVTCTKDPTPTSKILEEPREETVAKLLADATPIFSVFISELDYLISPETVFLDAPNQSPILHKKQGSPSRGGNEKAKLEFSARSSHFRRDGVGGRDMRRGYFNSSGRCQADSSGRDRADDRTHSTT